MSARGRFVTFEGIEGCGKSTQMRRLETALGTRDAPVLFTREPGGTKIGDVLRDVLLDAEHRAMTVPAEVLLYAASRAQLVTEVVGPALADGTHVICDRYVDSSLAYQAAGRGVDFDEVLRVNTWATGGLLPDRTILLDLPAQLGLERATRHGVDRIEQEPLEFHERVRKGYLELARQWPGRIVTVDATGTADEVFERVQALVDQALGGGPGGSSG